jgi:phosphoribosylaminoimidazole-succinocarboxamide synthase
MLVHHLKMLPVEFIVRNYTAGSLAKKMGVEEGVKLISPVVEMCFKSDELGDPFINDTYIKAFDLGKPEDVEEAKKIAITVNEILKDFFDKNGLMLVDYKLEFGTLNGKVLLADEITPDTMRLWDKVTLEKVDKDRFRRDLGGVEEAYKRVYDITASI